VKLAPEDLGVMLRLARGASRRYLRFPRLAHLVPDIEQDVLERALTKRLQGYRLDWEGYVRAARDALRHYAGDMRNNGRARYESVSLEALREETHAEPSEPAAASGPGAIALWRLQRLWPTLTTTQQAGVYSVLVDGYGAAGDAAEAYGVELSAISSGRQRALERVDNPSAFSRAASVGVRDLPPEERRAYRRVVSARYRARKRERLAVSP
jgi:hypothetical protein